MTQRTALIVAIAVTAFLVVLGGGLAVQAAATAAPAATAPTATATLGPSAEAEFQQREADYQARLQEANTQLEEAYAQQQALQAQLNQKDSSAASTATVSTKEATRLALLAAPGAALLRNPELVNYQGTLAYEVSLDRGLIYVDANSGQVLYNGAAAPVAPRVRNGEQGENHTNHAQEGQGDD